MNPPRASWKVWVAALRVRTLPAALAPVLAASALAWRDGVFQPWPAALCLWFALLVQVGTNFANDYYDFMQGADTAARVGPQRVVAAGLVAPETMRRAMAGVFAAAFLSGLLLIHWGGWGLLAIGVASIAGGVAYTGGPWPLGYHGLGDVAVFVFFGLVAVTATYLVQAGGVSVEAWWLGAAIGALAANILVVNNYRDVETDAVAGKRTLVVRWGRRAARLQYNLCLAGALALPLALWAHGHRPGCLVVLALVPFAWRLARRLRTPSSPRELIQLLGDSGKFLALYAVAFSAGMALERWL